MPDRLLRSFLPLAALFALLCPSPAAAWWEYGHETTARVAMRLVKPRTRAAVTALLRRSAALETPTCPARTPAQASVWPDCVKTLGDRFAYASAWHYQDADICKPFDLKSACAGGNCVSAQIARAQRMVADRKLPTRDRVEALAFLIHFVGDLHQPLHTSEHADDAGGNRLKVRYGAKPDTNLHAVWDGLLADPALSRPPAGAAGLLAEFGPAQRASWRGGTVEDWSREGWEIARVKVYGSVLADPCGGPSPSSVTIDEAKAETLMPVVREQVAKAGVRLARLLDEALDGNHPEVAHPPRAPRPAA